MSVARKKNTLLTNLYTYRYLYLLLLPAIVLIIIFNYGPISGLVVAFQDYKIMKGISGSRWVGFNNFISLFSRASFLTALRNTLFISILRIIFTFPMPIIFALLINELKGVRFKKTVQTISYLPYFISWVVISGMVIEVLSPQRGIVNAVIMALGGTATNFLTDSVWFVVILIVSGIWQGVGWGSIIYLSSLAGIPNELYESAEIDGANRFQKARYISLPGMIPMIIISLMLSISNILSAGFDQIFNLYTPVVYNVSDIIDTYMYRLAFIDQGGSNYSVASAVGLFKNGVGFLLLFFSNEVIRRKSDYTFF
jgi:putative aldouronate transport system permease protein